MKLSDPSSSRFLLSALPAYAQLGGLVKKAEQAQERKQQLDDLNITEDEETKLGADVSLKIRTRFGVVQDPAVHKYVTLVGTMLAEQTTRRKLPWTFIVLDTDGVNAFAAPGGFVHITRGALALIKSEAELAGVMGHEIAHVAQKHTVNAIRKSKGVQIAASETQSNRGTFLAALANRTYEMVLENAFDRATSSTPTKKASSSRRRRAMPAPAFPSFSRGCPSVIRGRPRRTVSSRPIRKPRSASDK